MYDSGSVSAGGERAALLTKKLQVSRWLALESLGEREAVVYHSATGARLQVSRALYEFLRCFEPPTTVEEALGGEATDGVFEHVEKLFAKGFLVDSAEKESPGQNRRTAAVAHTLWNCPVYRPGGPAAEVSVLGLPYDLASPGVPGMRAAPAAIRQRSLDFEYRVGFRSGEPRGWFDVDREKRILEGVTFSDWGDVVVQHGEAQRDFFARAGGLVDEIADAGSVPVLLGGDHSVTFPVVERLARRGKLAVLHLDAHTDFDPSVPEEIVNANCVGRRLWKLAGVERLVQVGHRGYTINPKVEQAEEGVEILTVGRYRREGDAALLAALPEELPLYVTLDVNVLDPVFAPGTSCPTPGGFTLDELKGVLHTVGRSREVVGLDLVGLHPELDPGPITSITACHLLLAALGEIMLRRAG